MLLSSQFWFRCSLDKRDEFSALPCVPLRETAKSCPCLPQRKNSWQGHHIGLFPSVWLGYSAQRQGIGYASLSRFPVPLFISWICGCCVDSSTQKCSLTLTYVSTCISSSKHHILNCSIHSFDFEHNCDSASHAEMGVQIVMDFGT